MTNYRGLDGFLSFGGYLAGPPKIKGAVSQGATTLNLDGNGSPLSGMVNVGDQFTVAGETGSPTHTVTGGPWYITAANEINGLTFSPGAATGGMADNAAITFVTNRIAQSRLWGIQSSIEALDATVQGDKWRAVVGGLASWTGNGEVLLDYADLIQKELVDKILTGTPSPSITGMLFGTYADDAAGGVTKLWYAAAVLSAFNIVGGGVGELFTAQFTFAGNGPLLPNWQP
jgi:hypothetical protein